MEKRYEDFSLPTLFLLWAAYQLINRFRAMRPQYTSGEIARITALSGNPPGA